MTFVKGQSGNPGGRGTEKEWRDAVRLAVHRELEDMEKQPPAKTKLLDIIARELVGKAIAGDVQAMREIGDRLDGKARQEVDNNISAGEGLKITVDLK